jgi:NADH-quinone oxidoreductase subunit M
MAEAPVLNLVLFLPLLGAAALWLLPRGSDGAVRMLTLAVMLVQLLLCTWLYLRYDAQVAALQFETRVPWIADWGVHYQIGLDGYNILLVMLTAYLGPLVVRCARCSAT